MRCAEHQQRLDTRLSASRRPRAFARPGALRAVVRAHAPPVQPTLPLGAGPGRDTHRHLPALRSVQPRRQHEPNRPRKRRRPGLRACQRSDASPLRNPAVRGLQPLSPVHRGRARPVLSARRRREGTLRRHRAALVRRRHDRHRRPLRAESRTGGRHHRLLPERRDLHGVAGAPLGTPGGPGRHAAFRSNRRPRRDRVHRDHVGPEHRLASRRRHRTFSRTCWSRKPLGASRSPSAPPTRSPRWGCRRCSSASPRGSSKRFSGTVWRRISPAARTTIGCWITPICFLASDERSGQHGHDETPRSGDVRTASRGVEVTVGHEASGQVMKAELQIPLRPIGLHCGR